jgi:hypothetical protein
MLLGFPGEAADMGPSGVPEEDHASFYQHVGHRDRVPSPAVAGIEGILDLLSFVRVLFLFTLLPRRLILGNTYAPCRILIQ